MIEKSVTDAIVYRRSVRVFKKDDGLDETKVQGCIVNATLAPNSSTLQLWEFYHIIESTVMEKITEACLNQNAAKTADQIVVVVSRKDLWRKRAQSNIEFLKKSFGEKHSNDYTKREKFALNYYKKLIPSIYIDFLGILGWLKYFIFQVIGLFRPIYKEVRSSDIRIVAHKSAALAAENFMLSMSAIGYDTCPMEGIDSTKMKSILGLPIGAEINMVIGCGIRAENGVYGPRFRVPFDQVYTKI